MFLITAQAIRKEIVEYGTKENLSKMDAGQRARYKNAKAWSRDAVRSISNYRVDVIAPTVGGIANVARNHQINDSAADVLLACKSIVDEIRTEVWW